jgi:NAD(P)-dependent dehydrogenase (short-subunit alcohol dehydrogenase family)
LLGGLGSGPLLREARGRIVMIGSIGTRFTPPFTGPVSASKSAIATMAEALRQELGHQPAPGSRAMSPAARGATVAAPVAAAPSRSTGARREQDPQPRHQKVG